ncbi:MAG: hypothetical protein K0Q73_2727, partial [Paenibacillus sp.]|nr:hypothetical protein [Paenibacillus sp.]
MSNVIKSFAYFPLDDKKLVETISPLEILRSGMLTDEANQLTPEQQQELTEATSMKEQILQDAETFAHEQID